VKTRKSTMQDVLIGLLAVERSKNQTLFERIKQLEESVAILTEENDELYKTLAEKPKEHKPIGFLMGEKRDL
jgi:hypothetical protein